MGLYRSISPISGRMGTLWTLASIRDAVVIEYGCMGHMLYGRVFMNRMGIYDGAKMYSTHIDETDISMGDTSRLKNVVNDIILQGPKAIFLIRSAVPEVIGTDMEQICKELRSEHDIPIVSFGCGGFDVDGSRGVQETLLTLVRELPMKIDRAPEPTFNIIGSCADMFRFHADAREIVRIMGGAFGMRLRCILTSDTSIGDIQRMGEAHIDLVIRREGEPAAKYMEERFGIGYVIGRPYGIEGTVKWIDDVASVLGIPCNKGFVNIEAERTMKQISTASVVFDHAVHAHPEDTTISLGGHADVVRGILDFAVNEMSFRKGACWCDHPNMSDDVVRYLNENDLMSILEQQKEGILMASGDVLGMFSRDQDLQISNPDRKWRLNPYESPFVGFRGAVNLAHLWLNALLEK